MAFNEVKKIVLPIQEEVAALYRVLSEKERRWNPQLVRKMNRMRIKVAELKGILLRLQNAEKKEVGYDK